MTGQHEHEHEHGGPGGHTHGGGHDGTGSPEGQGGDATMGLHGMLLFGGDRHYLSHLPMFESPHNFQVILDVELDDAVGEALGQGLHTFEPELFPIAELDPRQGGSTRSSIEGTIYRGHFERGGQPIARGAVARIRTVVYFDELDVEAVHGTDQDLTYLCFGGPGQIHLAHLVTASPDFDQVLTARLVPGTVTDPAGRPVDGEVTGGFDRAVPVRFPGRKDTPADRLVPDEIAGASFFATSGPTGSHGFGTDIEVGAELYVELRELGSV